MPLKFYLQFQLFNLAHPLVLAKIAKTRSHQRQWIQCTQSHNTIKYYTNDIHCNTVIATLAY